MFMGEYSHNVDAKGRLIVPAKFREQLGDQFVVTKGVDGCLYVYSQEEWKRIEEKFREVNLTTKDARKFMRFFFAGAAMCGKGCCLSRCSDQDRDLGQGSLCGCKFL